MAQLEHSSLTRKPLGITYIHIPNIYIYINDHYISQSYVRLEVAANHVARGYQELLPGGVGVWTRFVTVHQVFHCCLEDTCISEKKHVLVKRNMYQRKETRVDACCRIVRLCVWQRAQSMSTIFCRLCTTCTVHSWLPQCKQQRRNAGNRTYWSLLENLLLLTGFRKSCGINALHTSRRAQNTTSCNTSTTVPAHVP